MAQNLPPFLQKLADNQALRYGLIAGGGALGLKALHEFMGSKARKRRGDREVEHPVSHALHKALPTAIRVGLLTGAGAHYGPKIHEAVKEHMESKATQREVEHRQKERSVRAQEEQAKATREGVEDQKSRGAFGSKLLHGLGEHISKAVAHLRSRVAQIGAPKKDGERVPKKVIDVKGRLLDDPEKRKAFSKGVAAGVPAKAVRA